VTRSSLTFILISLILVLAGCASVPTIDNSNNINSPQNSYIQNMINDDMNISENLRDEISFNLEILFQYKKNEPEFYEIINKYIEDGYITKLSISKIKQAIINNRKIASIQSIDKTYKTSKQNREYIVESILKNDTGFNIVFDNLEADLINTNLLDSNLLYFCNSYIRDQRNMIENFIFKKENPADVLVIYTKPFENHANNLKQLFPDTKFSLINNLNHEIYSQNILGIDKSLGRLKKIQDLDQNIELEHSPRERKDFKKVYFLMDYSIGKSIVPIFRSYLLNSDFYATTEILSGATSMEQLTDFYDLLLPSPKYFYEKISSKPKINSIDDEINQGLIEDLLLTELLKEGDIYEAYVLLNSGVINYSKDKCIQRDLFFWKINQENI
jgi:hypothetical protein